jgi:hypothetical protein
MRPAVCLHTTAQTPVMAGLYPGRADQKGDQSCLPSQTVFSLECDFQPGATLEWMAYRPNIRKGNRSPGRLERTAGRARARSRRADRPSLLGDNISRAHRKAQANAAFRISTVTSPVEESCRAAVKDAFRQIPVDVVKWVARGYVANRERVGTLARGEAPPVIRRHVKTADAGDGAAKDHPDRSFEWQVR